MRFAIVGAAGFIVDAGTLHLAVHNINAGFYTGRVISYLAAATFTWMLNRRYTFAGQQDHNRIREYLKFLGANAAGGLLNYSIYALLIHASQTVRQWPTIGVAAGSIGGLIVNFLLSRRLVFNSR